MFIDEDVNVGRNVSGQKWTGSLANAGRFGFALSGSITGPVHFYLVNCEVIELPRICFVSCLGIV